jgi:sulfur-oxidizing protein SoxA
MKPSLLDAVSLATLLRRAGGLLTAALLLGASLAPGEEPNAVEEIAKYRQMLEDGNPAELMEMQGETLWSTPRGPRQASLERCDLGLGPGKLEGAYARLPRYFPDTGRVEDVESRLVSCMMMLQGLSREEATRGWYARNSDLEALTTFVAGRSKGYAIDVSVQHPREAQLYAIGEEIFWRRSGPLDFGCSTCHSLDERRIRLQELPNLASVAGARASIGRYLDFYNTRRPHSSLDRKTPDEAYFGHLPQSAAA